MSSIINATTTAGVSVQGDNSGSLQLATNNGTTAVTIDTNQRAAFVAGTAALPAITTTGDTNTGIFFPAADTIAFTEGGTESMRIDSSGRVGIGTSSPAYQLTVAGYSNANAANKFAIGSIADYQALFYYETGNETFTIENTSDYLNSAIIFRTNNAERMRIDSSGDLLIGTATQNTLDGGKLQVLQSADNCAVFRTTSTNFQIVCQGGQGSNTGNQISFRYGSSVVGNIISTSSTTSYNTSSDYRLKENVVPMTNALATVAQLKPCTYTWKSDGKNGQGFIAHELQAVVPQCVTGEKDAVETYTDEDGNEQTRIKPQGVDTSFLVATLTSAIQELKAELDATKAEVQALKGTL